MNTLELFWKSVRFPLLWIGFVVLLFAGWWLLRLPPESQLLPLIQTYLTKYGLWVVFIAALLESMLVVGWYFPGGVVIFFSVAAAPTPAHAALTVLCVIAGLLAGYSVNFFLGKYGWYRLLLRFGIRRQLEEAQHNLQHYGVQAIFSSYWMPGLGALVATAAGVLQYDTRKFMHWSLFGTVAWSTFWGTVVYFLGQRSLSLVLNPFIIVGFIVVWGLSRFAVDWYRARDKAQAPPR